MLRLKVVKGNFTAELQRRIREFSVGEVNIGLSIQPGNEWWYYQEWGTATHASSPDFPSTAPSGYGIKPVHGDFLTFPGPQGEQVFTPEVKSPNHKGVRPKGYIRMILPDLQEQIKDDVAFSLAANNYSKSAVKEILLDRTMPRAQEMIASSMSEALGQTRTDGRAKLGSASPSEVFQAETFITDLSTS